MKEKREAKNDSVICLRLGKEIYAHLCELIAVAGVSRNDFIKQIIEVEYDKMQGNPKLKEAFEGLRNLTKDLESLWNRLAGTPPPSLS